MIDTIHLHLDFMSETGNSPDHETGEIGLASRVDMAFRGSGYRPDIYSFEELRSHFEKVLGKQNALNLINVYPFKFPGYQQFKGIRDDWWSYDNCVHDDARRRSYINCHFGNLRITVGTSFFYDGTVYNDYIDIVGSLQKWYREYSIWDDPGSTRDPLNEATITGPMYFEEIKNAFEALEHQLGIEIKKATIRRLDFGVSLNMDKNPKVYMTRLLRYNNQLNSWLKGSVYFGMNTQQTLCFYNKTQELKKHREYKSVQYPENLLRYEVRLMDKKSVSKKLGITPVVGSLFDERVFIKMLDLLEIIYANIVKRKSLKNELGNFSTAGNLGDQCILFAINHFGLDTLLNAVDEQMKMGILASQQPSRIKKKLKDVNKSGSQTTNTIPDITDELDKKMKEMCDWIRKRHDNKITFPF